MLFSFSLPPPLSLHIKSQFFPQNFLYPSAVFFSASGLCFKWELRFQIIEFWKLDGEWINTFGNAGGKV